MGEGQRPQVVCGKTTWGLPLTEGVVGCDGALCSGQATEAAGEPHFMRVQRLLYNRGIDFSGELFHE
jgi:hypothetical protein